jgi:hypothetical protein
MSCEIVRAIDDNSVLGKYNILYENSGQSCAYEFNAVSLHGGDSHTITVTDKDGNVEVFYDVTGVNAPDGQQLGIIASAGIQSVELDGVEGYDGTQGNQIWYDCPPKPTPTGGDIQLYDIESHPSGWAAATAGKTSLYEYDFDTLGNPCSLVSGPITSAGKLDSEGIEVIPPSFLPEEVKISSASGGEFVLNCNDLYTTYTSVVASGHEFGVDDNILYENSGQSCAYEFNAVSLQGDGSHTITVTDKDGNVEVFYDVTGVNAPDGQRLGIIASAGIQSVELDGVEDYEGTQGNHIWYNCICRAEQLTVETVAASSVETSLVAANAVDGWSYSRWASDGPVDGADGEQWLKLDMDEIVFIDSIILQWEAAYSRNYDISVSNDDILWEIVSSGNNGEDGIVHLSDLDARGRYIRITSHEGDDKYGISLFEVKIFGDPYEACSTPPILPTILPSANCDGTHEIIDIISASASSQEGAHWRASQAIDHMYYTRWSSAFEDNQWFAVDLGLLTSISEVRLRWERAYASEYKLQKGDSSSGPWTDLVHITDSDGGTDIHDGLNEVTQYLRLECIHRASNYGFSLQEFEVRGTPVCNQPSVTV